MQSSRSEEYEPDRRETFSFRESSSSACSMSMSDILAKVIKCVEIFRTRKQLDFFFASGTHSYVKREISGHVETLRTI